MIVPPESEARRQVAEHRGVEEEQVEIIELQEREQGPTAKYTLEGEAGVAYARLGPSGGSVGDIPRHRDPRPLYRLIGAFVTIAFLTGLVLGAVAVYIIIHP